MGKLIQMRTIAKLFSAILSIVGLFYLSLWMGTPDRPASTLKSAGQNVEAPNVENLKLNTKYVSQIHEGAGWLTTKMRRLPVARGLSDIGECVRAIQDKDTLSMGQLIDGGRVKMYPGGSKVDVITVDGRICLIMLKDGTSGYVTDKMIEQ